MIVRIWSTGLIEEMKDGYLNFAKNNSLPMFRQQEGILGVNVLVKEDKSLVLTYWNNMEDIIKMENNALYKHTVAAIQISGFLKAPQDVEIFDAPIHFQSMLEHL